MGKKAQSLASTTPKLTVSTNSINSQYSGGYITINVTSTNKWDIYNLPSWCYITNKTNTSFKLNVTQNRTKKFRYAVFQVKTSNGATSQYITIAQEANPPTFSTSFGCFSAMYNDIIGGNFKFGIKAWYIEVKTNFSFNSWDSQHEAYADSYYYKKGSEKITRWNVMMGINWLWRRRFSIYTGAGYGVRNYTAQNTSGRRYTVLDNSARGLELEGGANVFVTKRFGITAGYSVLAFQYSEFMGGVIFRW